MPPIDFVLILIASVCVIFLMAGRFLGDLPSEHRGILHPFHASNGVDVQS
jgi:hypothetical protein